MRTFFPVYLGLRSGNLDGIWDKQRCAPLFYFDNVGESDHQLHNKKHDNICVHEHEAIKELKCVEVQMAYVGNPAKDIGVKANVLF